MTDTTKATVQIDAALVDRLRGEARTKMSMEVLITHAKKSDLDYTKAEDFKPHQWVLDAVEELLTMVHATHEVATRTMLEAMHEQHQIDLQGSVRQAALAVMATIADDAGQGTWRGVLRQPVGVKGYEEISVTVDMDRWRTINDRWNIQTEQSSTVDTPTITWTATRKAK